MKEVKKLYKLAGVNYRVETLDSFPSYEIIIPSFTAEKQLELIKWLARKSNLIRIGYHNKENTYHIFSNEVVGGFHYNFSESIVTYTQCILDFCDETEQEEIRKILKG